jgi:hypothetical protein
MKTKYAVELRVDGKMYRYSTTRMALDLTNSCGEVSKVSFVPWLKKASGLESELDLTNKDIPIPTTKLEIWDPAMLMLSRVENIDIEQVGCRFYEIVGDTVTTFYGYATDLSYDGSTLGITIRSSESATPLDNINDLFSFDSFQSFEIISPRDIQVGTQYIINENTPWTVYVASFQRSSLANSNYGEGGHAYPDVSFVRLATKTNNYEYYAPALGELNADLPGTEYHLQTLTDTLFDNPAGFYYAEAVVGYDHETGKQEIIKYAWALPNSKLNVADGTFDNSFTGGNYILSGIPTDAYPDPIGFYGGDVVEEANLVNNYSIKYKHLRNEIIAPLGAFDTVWVNANGLYPSYTDDPEFGIGFLDTGRTISDTQGNQYALFSRYKMEDIVTSLYDTNLDDGTFITAMLKLNIHSRNADPNHVHAYSGANEIQASLSIGDPLRVASFEFAVYSIDLHLLSIDEEVYSDMYSNFGLLGLSIEDQFKDRYRGLRIDMFNDFSDFIETIDSQQLVNGTQQTITQTNNSLLNNANGKFGICTSSEIVKVGSELYERLYFTVPAQSIDSFKYVEVDADGTVDQTELESVDNTSAARNQLFVNYLKTHHNAKDITDWDNGFDFFGEQARTYFLNSRYRIIHNPVPENSQDLGKMFPICYGKLVNVPILQCISKKVFGNEEGTAGDDYYVYASHRCDISTPADISIQLFSEQKGSDGLLKPLDAKDFSNIAAQNIIQSPFPNFLDGHFVYKNGRIKSDGRLMFPYAKLENKDTLDGLKTYGLRFQGGLWDSRAGQFDKRYGIRNGVGSSTIYGSFRGYKDRNNKFLLHPVDVLRHYIETYANGAYSDLTFNSSSLDYVKSKTPKYEVSIYMEEPLNIDEFVSKIGEQFGLFVYQDRGQINLAIPEIEQVDMNSPISENLNLLEGTTLSVKGYKTTYNELEYNYAFDYPNSSFRHSIKLDKNNDPYCAKASRNRGDRKTFKVDADWVRSSIVAHEVARRYAKIVSGGNKTYECSLKWVTGINHSVGQTVPMTCSQHGLDNTPVLITSLKSETFGYSLTVLKLT